MSESETLGGAPSPGTGRKVARVALTAVIFAIFGPLVGGIVAIVGIVLLGVEAPDIGTAGAVMLVMALYGLWVAYPMGILPALAVGLAIGLIDIRGGTRLVAAAGIGLVAGLAWSFNLGGQSTDDSMMIWVVTAAALAATLACWALTRPGVIFFRAPAAP